MTRNFDHLSDILGPLARPEVGPLNIPLPAENYLDPHIRNWEKHKHPDFVFSFWPVTEEYYSPLNPLYLHELDHFREAHHLDVVQSRDGLLPLLWFFEKNPIPETKTKLLVHRSFKNFVPVAWRKFCGTYVLGNHPERPIAQSRLPGVRRILIDAIITQNFIDPDFLKKRLEQMFSQIEVQKLKVEQFDCFLLFRDDPYHWCVTDRLVGEFMHELSQTISKSVSGKVRFYNEKEFLNKNSFSDCALFEVNKRYFSSDNYAHFLALSKGARLLEDHRPTQQESFVPLSWAHGMWVDYNPQWKDYSLETTNYLEKIHALALIDDKNEGKNYWPKDFWLYAKALLELEGTC